MDVLGFPPVVPPLTVTEKRRILYALQRATAARAAAKSFLLDVRHHFSVVSTRSAAGHFARDIAERLDRATVIDDQIAQYTALLTQSVSKASPLGAASEWLQVVPIEDLEIDGPPILTFRPKS